MDEHQAAKSELGDEPELTDEQKASIEGLAEEFDRLKLAGLAADAMDLLVLAVGARDAKLAYAYAEAFRIRTAATKNGFRVGL